MPLSQTLLSSDMKRSASCFHTISKSVLPIRTNGPREGWNWSPIDNAPCALRRRTPSEDSDANPGVARSRLQPVVKTTSTAEMGNRPLVNPGQVALGDCSPRAPTDPYVPALEHTVPQIMVSLREVEAWIALHEREQAGNGGAKHRISPSASSGCCCGD